MLLTTIMEKVAEKLHDGDTALIALVDEDGEADLDRKLAPYKVQILRFDAAAIAAEVEKAEKMQREMEHQARKQLRATRREEAKEKSNRTEQSGPLTLQRSKRSL